MMELNEADVLSKPKRARNYALRGEKVSVIWLKSSAENMKLEEGAAFSFRGRTFTVRRSEILLTTGGRVIRLYYK
jgi:hypothetical protein